MRVEDILRRKGEAVQTALTSTSVVDAIRLMTGPPPIGALVICDDGPHRIDGILTERDVMRGLHREGASLLERSVGEVMSRHVPQCASHDSLAHLMAEMTRTRHRHFAVVDAGMLCGIVSIGDVVQHRLGEMQLERDVLRDMYLALR